MSTHRFAVNVTPKPGILDPQGRAVEGSLDHLGISGVSAVRVGRRVELTVEAADEAAARAVVERLAGGAAGQPAHRGLRHRDPGRRLVARRGDQRQRAGLMPVRVGVVVFPGSNCDRDTVHALDRAGAEPVVLWHEQASLDGVAAVVLPGGFAYGDYLRAGVIARFSPVMRAVEAFAARGRAGARHLQRVPGAGRGRARARRAAAQPGAALPGP